MPTRCHHSGCATQATYGEAHTRTAVYCATHRLADQVDVRNKGCERPGCTRQANFGVAKARFCAAHCRATDVKLRGMFCQWRGCGRAPAYGQPDTRKRLRCSTHRMPGDVDYKQRRCAHRAGEPDACRTQPSFAPPGTRWGLRCAAHRVAGDVDVKTRRCPVAGCKRRAAPGERRDYCQQHRRTGEANPQGGDYSRRAVCNQPGFGPRRFRQQGLAAEGGVAPSLDGGGAAAEDDETFDDLSSFDEGADALYIDVGGASAASH